ncbi:Endonuclease/exonuclease/phosphatase [Pyronema omphalodes]|nr:Endonuclease/exonuclease/phosphatase [Pyronema omphalodes]
MLGRTLATSALLFLARTYAQSSLSGSFDILTYNIAGLPEPLSGSDPVNNTPLISQRIGNFSIVHVQEDFAYHDALLFSDRHPFRTTTSGNVPIGSGLNTLSNYPWTDLKRETWKACWFGSGDCLTPKGFTAMRMQLAPGVNIDFYNLHAEAGDTDLDFAARQIGFQQLSNFISSYSSGNAIVLAGDTNTRYTSAKDPTRLFAQKNGMSDIWVVLEKGGIAPSPGPSIECPFPIPAGKEDNKCEQIDKIHFRGSKALKLIPRGFVNHNYQFLRPDGGPLSDHMPLQAIFDWEVSRSLRAGPEVLGGRENSGYWNDLADYKGAFESPVSATVLSSITIRSGSRIDALKYSLSDGRVLNRGGSGGGDSKQLALQDGENVQKVELCIGTRDDGKKGVFWMRVESDRGRSLEAGKRTDSCTAWMRPGEGWTIAGFQGHTGTELDAVGVLWGKR